MFQYYINCCEAIIIHMDDDNVRSDGSNELDLVWLCPVVSELHCLQSLGQMNRGHHKKYRRKIYLCKLQSSANKSVWGFNYGIDFVCWWPSSQRANGHWPCMITSAEMLLNHKMKIVHREQSVKNLKWDERTRFKYGQMNGQMDEQMEKITNSLFFL